ncbi:dynamin family protein [Brooklawnia sp.]|uniref:dynamin family protein n=1 Tax=Brooklawnia sp. TaxID=2699740 RepID=UPI00311FCAEC
MSEDELADTVALIGTARGIYARDKRALAVLDALERRLTDPLRLAIAGIVKAGKSTLLNAILGEQIAPTDAGECTKTVTWYRYSQTPSITVHLHDGPARRLPVRRERGMLAIDLGELSADDVEHIDISWPAPALKSLILIDTPGIASISQNISARSLDFLTPNDAPSEADAIVYLLRHLHPSDLGFLEAFRDTAAGASQTVNAVTVLSRADEIGSGRIDSLLSAGKVALRYERDGELASLALGVVPVAGLLAEGARTLRETEFMAFRELAALDRPVRERLLVSADRFVRPAAGLRLGERERKDLLARFGLFGVRLATSLIRAGADDSTRLATQLVQHSGLVELEEFVQLHFQSRAATLKTRGVIDRLEHLVSERPRSGTQPIAAGIEQIRANAHGLRELTLLSSARVTGLGLSPGETDAAVRITGGSGLDAATRLGMPLDATTQELRAKALTEIDLWRSAGQSPMLNRRGADVSRVVIRSLETIASDLGPSRAREDLTHVATAG